MRICIIINQAINTFKLRNCGVAEHWRISCCPVIVLAIISPHALLSWPLYIVVGLCLCNRNYVDASI